ncbi:porin [Shimia biformata]|uniref:porin n=1 Tax=Shimia biformata TaxID=1294299 RepID=UPI00194FAB8D|nr:porin [Shimia biformata]
MKKVLFATTALVATAGVAAADVTLSGSARFGVIYTEGATTDEWALHNRFTLNIDGTAETDSGATMHARVRVRGGETGSGSTNSTTTGVPHGSAVSSPQVGVSAGGFRVNVGNINGALESTPGLYAGAVGLTGLGWGNLSVNTDGAAGYWAWDSFSSAAGGVNGVEAIYSGGAFGAHLSYSPVTDRTAIHGSYTFGSWTVAVAYQDSDTAGEDKLVGTIGGSFGAFGVGLSVADNDGVTKGVLSGSFGVGASTNITAYIGSEDGSDENYGIGFTHGLGGATIAGGVVQTTSGTTMADLGVRFNF